MKRYFVIITALFVTSCMVAIFPAGCSKPEPILVGFSGQLSGAYADLGIKGRDGVMLAVEQINAAGGIAGRPIWILVKDDKGTPEGARTADRELIEKGVVAIIGHMTSSQTMAVMDIIAEANITLISPTTSTDKLAGLDDHFFRVHSICSQAAHPLARHVYNNRGVKKIAVITDTDNASYTKSYRDAFSEAYARRSGQVIGQWDFSSAEKPDFDRIVREIKHTAPEALLIIASPLDTALIAQKVRAIDQKTPLFVADWSQTDAMLLHGGRAVEGIETTTCYDSNYRNPAFQVFRSRYLDLFGSEPTFAGSLGHEAMLILAESLKKTKGSKTGLREAMLKIKSFEGLIGTISMDQYGDVIRTVFLASVKNGRIETRTIHP